MVIGCGAVCPSQHYATRHVQGSPWAWYRLELPPGTIIEYTPYDGKDKHWAWRCNGGSTRDAFLCKTCAVKLGVVW